MIEAAARRLGRERGRDVTITFAKGIHDRAPISRSHKCKNGDWDNTTHNRKLGIRGKANTIGNLYKDCDENLFSEDRPTNLLNKGQNILKWIPGPVRVALQEPPTEERPG